MTILIFAGLAAWKMYDWYLEGKGEVKEKLDEYPYKLKPYFFSRSEQALYQELRRQVGDRYAIFAQVRLADFIEVDVNKYQNRSKWQSYWNKIRSKHVDFLLCDPVTLKPQVAIELNGKSHNSDKMIARDKFVEVMYKTVGIKFITIRSGEKFKLSISKI